MPHVRSSLFLGLAVVVHLTTANAAVHAATPLMALRYAPDITVSLTGTIVSPSDVAEDDLNGAVSLVGIGNIPADAHVDAYLMLPNGNQLLSFDTTVSLPGGVTVEPADVVRFNGSTYTVVIKASVYDVPADVNTDAIAMANGDLLLSFDVSFRYLATTFEDEDLIRFQDNAGSVFTPFFTGADAGVPADLDLDGAQVLGPTRLLLSFDGSGTVGGVSFDDDDVLEYDTTAGTWELAYNGAAEHSGWETADLVALYAVPVPPTPTVTATATPSNTAEPSSTATATPAETATPTPTTPPGATITPTPSPTLAPTHTTVPGTETPTQTVAPTHTTAPGTETPTPMPSSVATETMTATSTPLVTPTSTQTGLAETPTPTATEGPSVTPTSGPATCVGDCNGSGEVTINELLVMVNIALGNTPVSECLAGDGNNDGEVTVDEIITAVNHALTGC